MVGLKLTTFASRRDALFNYVTQTFVGRERIELPISWVRTRRNNHYANVQFYLETQTAKLNSLILVLSLNNTQHFEFSFLYGRLKFKILRPSEIIYHSNFRFSLQRYENFSFLQIFERFSSVLDKSV